MVIYFISQIGIKVVVFRNYQNFLYKSIYFSNEELLKISYKVVKSGLVRNMELYNYNLIGLLGKLQTLAKQVKTRNITMHNCFYPFSTFFSGCT